MGDGHGLQAPPRSRRGRQLELDVFGGDHGARTPSRRPEALEARTTNSLHEPLGRRGAGGDADARGAGQRSEVGSLDGVVDQHGRAAARARRPRRGGASSTSSPSRRRAMQIARRRRARARRPGGSAWRSRCRRRAGPASVGEALAQRVDDARGLVDGERGLREVGDALGVVDRQRRRPRRAARSTWMRSGASPSVPSTSSWPSWPTSTIVVARRRRSGAPRRGPWPRAGRWRR